ncbi:LysR family transcriptional regulator [Alphaproteobacteria bacterium KMM 3653]|uniref:LysR family transcriptional regulator n=1 Tax=Harenicola maris TaxID=2841044 RepID=A0AAP2CU60_9RHOB|nr:LysR family transcriptional regulator [Harenicola maris]
MDHLPSLASLRAFEGAARHGSFSAAARELNVTHAAIAQHLRRLEDHFGTPLMHRAGRGMALTPQGEALAASLTEGFALIHSGVRALTEQGKSRPVRVSLTPSFAENWLMPRIGQFWSAHPDIPVEISPSISLTDLRRDGIDLAIRYGIGPWPGVEAQVLTTAPNAVVAAPSLGLKPVTTLADLQDQHWLMGGTRPEEGTWAKANGLDFDAARKTQLPTGNLANQAARAGNGVLISPATLVEQDIKSGHFTLLYSEDESPLAYHIITLPGRASANAQTFIKWLKRAA